MVRTPQMTQEALIRKVQRESIHAFDRYAKTKTAEISLAGRARAMHVLSGMDIAEYFMVEPLIDGLLAYLPKKEAKEVFRHVVEILADRINEYFLSGEEQNSIDVAVAHNRRKLRELGIPEEKIPFYGGRFYDIILAEGSGKE